MNLGNFSLLGPSGDGAADEAAVEISVFKLTFFKFCAGKFADSEDPSAERHRVGAADMKIYLCDMRLGHPLNGNETAYRRQHRTESRCAASVGSRSVAPPMGTLDVGSRHAASTGLCGGTEDIRAELDGRKKSNPDECRGCRGEVGNAGVISVSADLRRSAAEAEQVFDDVRLFAGDICQRLYELLADLPELSCVPPVTWVALRFELVLAELYLKPCHNEANVLMALFVQFACGGVHALFLCESGWVFQRLKNYTPKPTGVK